jgi:hypothetical protein
MFDIVRQHLYPYIISNHRNFVRSGFASPSCPSSSLRHSIRCSARKHCALRDFSIDTHWWRDSYIFSSMQGAKSGRPGKWFTCTNRKNVQGFLDCLGDDKGDFPEACCRVTGWSLAGKHYRCLRYFTEEMESDGVSKFDYWVPACRCQQPSVWLLMHCLCLDSAWLYDRLAPATHEKNISSGYLVDQSCMSEERQRDRETEREREPGIER